MLLEQIRRAAIQKMPYATRALLTLTPVATSKIPKNHFAADESWRFYYNPESLEDDNYIERHANAMCVEVARLLQKHPQRAARLIPKKEYSQEYHQKIAIACSTALAKDLIHGCDAVKNLPGCRYLLPRNMTLEGVYKRVLSTINPPEIDFDALRKRWSQWGNKWGRGSQNQHQQTQQPQQGEQQQGQGGQQSADQTPQTPKKEKKLNPLPPEIEDVIGSSAADGIKREWEEEHESCRLKNDFQDIPERQMSPQMIIKMAVQQAGKMVEAGEANAALRQWVEYEMMERPVPPRSLESLLRDYHETTPGYDIKRYNGRNRRQHSLSEYNGVNFCLPNYCSPKINILVILDTSGSMDRTDSRRGMEWISTLMKKYNITESCAFYTGDDTPQRQGKLTPEFAATFCLDGDGGTHMGHVARAAYNDAVKQADRPNMVIVVTDGETPWEGLEHIDVPVVIGILGDEDCWDTSDALRYLPKDMAHVTWAIIPETGNELVEAKDREDKK